MPFPAAPAALQNKAINAAWLTEPFLTQASQKLGATEILDTATGPAENLPIARLDLLRQHGCQGPEGDGGVPAGDREGSGRRGHP